MKTLLFGFIGSLILLVVVCNIGAGINKNFKNSWGDLPSYNQSSTQLMNDIKSIKNQGGIDNYLKNAMK